MHPLEQHYVGGSDAALSMFGLTKIAIVMGADKLKALEAYRARPKGLAAVPGAAGLPAAPVPQLGALAGPASQMQMANPAHPPVLPGGSGLELDRAGYQGGYGTQGLMPGAVLQPQTGKVVGLPNKLASLFMRPKV